MTTTQKGIYLGDGQWATKDGNLLATKQVGKRFLNKEFTVDRGSDATYVDRDGLIKQFSTPLTNLVQNGDFEELSDDLVTNGSFDTDSDWTKQIGWSISGGTANCDGTNFAQLYQTNVLTQNKTYKVTYTISSYVSGSIRVKLGNSTNGLDNNANGTYTQYIYFNETNLTFHFRSNSFIGSIDNVSVQQVDPNDYWTLGSDWSIGDNALVGNSSITENEQRIFTTSVSRFLKITFDAVVTSGEVAVYMEGSSKQWVSTTGSYTIYANSSAFDLEIDGRNSNPFTGSITNVSVQDITPIDDKPRIDFTNDTEGHLLLEPESRNLITDSENLKDGYSTTESSVDLNDAVSPDGTTTANKFNSTATPSSISKTHANSSALFHTTSIFLKKGTIDIVTLSVNGGTPAISASTTVNLTSGTITASSGNGSITPTITNYGNDWYRITASSTSNGNTASPTVLIVNSSTTANGYFYMWGLQFEGLPYATSYIPTAGSLVTRTAETCTGAGDVDDFDSTAGILYAEIAALADDGTSRHISINDGTAANKVEIYYDSTTNEITGHVNVNGASSAFFQEVVTSVLDFNKVALKYKTNDFSIFINGSRLDTDTSGVTFSSNTLNNLSFDKGNGTLDFYGKVKAIKVIKGAVVEDTESPEYLTTQTFHKTFNALATANGYTII